MLEADWAVVWAVVWVLSAARAAGEKTRDKARKLPAAAAVNFLNVMIHTSFADYLLSRPLRGDSIAVADAPCPIVFVHYENESLISRGRIALICHLKLHIYGGFTVAIIENIG
ncbi:hypothetical protein D3C72_1802890 [compost metagenome]